MSQTSQVTLTEIGADDTGAPDGAASKELRVKRLEKDGYECSNCGGSEDLQVHHIVPRSKGGVTKLGNLRTLCADCHYEVHGDVGIITTDRSQVAESQTRWLPTVDELSGVIEGANHPFARVVFLLLAKTGIGLQELVDLKPPQIHLRDGGFGITSTVGTGERPFLILPKREDGPGYGNTKRLSDTKIPIDWELEHALIQYLRIRPDPIDDNLLLDTWSDWGESVDPNGIRYEVKKYAEKCGMYEVGAGRENNLTPAAFRSFFKDRYQGQPAVREYILGQKYEIPFSFDEISRDYKQNIYTLTRN